MTEVINPPPGDIVFASDGGVEVGRVIMRSGEPMHFVGNADEAARVFFDCFIALYSSEVQTLRSKLDGLSKAVRTVRGELEFDLTNFRNGAPYHYCNECGSHSDEPHERECWRGILWASLPEPSK